jgi:DME family drug/metabolite transporter
MSRARPPDGRLSSVAAVLAAAMLFGTTGTSQALGPPDATPLAIGAIRLVLGALTLAAIAWLRRPGTGRSWGQHAPALLLGGVAVAVYQLGWFAGLRRTGVAVGTVVGIGSGPVMAGLLHRSRGRGLPPAWLAGTAATVLGTGLLAARGGGERAIDPAGLALVLVAVLGYVSYVEVAQRAIQRGLDVAGAMAGMFGAGAALLAPILALEPLGWLARPDGATMALHLGVITIGVAYTLYGWGLRRLSVPTVVTLTLAEPLTAALLGTMVLGERLGPHGWLGAASVTVGLLATARGKLPRARQGDGADPS